VAGKERGGGREKGRRKEEKQAGNQARGTACPKNSVAAKPAW